MNLTIIGASAGVGLKCVERALNRNHTVTTLSRQKGGLNEHPGLKSYFGSATNIQDVENAITQADAVIVAVGTGKSTKATKLYTEVATALIGAQKHLHTKIPFIILVGFGAGNSSKYQGFFMRLIFRLLLKDVYTNKTKMEEMIAASSINWEFVRPGMLNDGALTEIYRVETLYRKGMNIGAISRSDVADFLVKQAENPTKLGQYPALSHK